MSVVPIHFTGVFGTPFHLTIKITSVLGVFINHVEPKTIIDWCIRNPELRYARIAQLITPYEMVDGFYQWSFLAGHILHAVANPNSVLEAFYDLLWPSSWSDSLALIMEPRIKLIEVLCASDNDEIRKWAVERKPEMLKRVNDVRIWEERRNRAEERFE